MDNSRILIRGAREHNLQNVNLDLPRNQLIVFTGVSGSGKSSLAFDTLYAEGQRRYVESLSSYARQFLGQMQKPDVDYLAGLSPSISIQQKTAGRNPRSTVGTITEIYDYLRVLFARVGQGHCTECGRPITAQSREQIIARILALPAGTRFLVLAPVVRGQKGEYKDLFEEMLKRGFVRARVDGQVVRLTDDLKLDRKIKHNIEIVIDRLKSENAAALRPRLADAVEQALNLANGDIIIATERGESEEATKKGGAGASSRETMNQDSADLLLSAHYACTHCSRSYEPPSPQLFSFNSPGGMCMECDGLGTLHSFDPDLLIPDPALSFFGGAIPLVGPMKGMGRWRKHIFEGIAATVGIDLKTPWQDLTEEQRNALLWGTGDRHITYEWKQRGGGVWKHGGKWEGIVPQLLSSFKKTAAGPRRMQLEKYMRSMRCPRCKGQRLNAQARAVRLGGKTLVELCALPVGDLARWFEADGLLEKSFDHLQRTIADEVLKEIRGRLGFLLNVGLHYLTLDRSAPSLSGGEAQRIRLAGQIGCGLVGVLYILDEPSIGLHPRDNERLLRSILQLRDMGNTVIVVEHDEDTMRAADFIVDFGPGPGVRGGHVVSAGSYAEVSADPQSVTGQYLAGTAKIEVPKQRRPRTGKSLEVIGAKHNNLKNLDVEFPLGQFVVVTGVSGSGKSSLVNDILFEGLRSADCGLRIEGSEEADADNGDADESDNPQSAIRNPQSKNPQLSARIEGTEHIDKVIDIDQSAIGRTPRSNPATYIKVFDEIRSLFALLPEAKVRGYPRGRFSFNRPGGRCEACEGNGSNRLEMDFLADVWVTCAVCEGRRFNRETLQVRYKAKNIHEVLEMDVQEALEHFENVPRIREMLQTLHDVGLDYIKLGQPSPTLSGGEAQRVKLAKELCRRSTGRTVYILDEPTTGLHFEDIRKLLQVLHGFVDNGNTVLVIEHNLDVIKTADWVIDLGPEGGSGGGELVIAGTPEEVAACEASFTGQALQRVLVGPVSNRPKARKAKADDSLRGSTKVADSLRESNRLAERVGHTGPITHLTVQGASQHNLKHVSASLPREKMSVFSGPSGSGKSSLALDTIYAEGQRRYIESLSAYARQFLGQMQKPKVEHVSGLSPAISIEQKTTSKSPRSTVGTVTEVYDYLRILFARLGHPYCPTCHIPVGTQTADEIIDKIVNLPEGTKLYLMAPIERHGQEKYETLWDEIRRAGYVRMRVDGKSFNIDEPPAIDHRRKHDVEVIIDRLVARPNQRTRVADAVEAGLDLGRGVVRVAYVEDGKDEPAWKVEKFSQHFACDQCGRSFESLNPHHFSFNSPVGWCPTCEGLGVQSGANPAVLIRDAKRSLRDGALAAWPEITPENPFTRFAEALAKQVGFSLDEPFDHLDPEHQHAILHGTGETWMTVDCGLEDRTKVAKPRKRKSANPQSAIRNPQSKNPQFQYKGIFPAIDEASRVSFVYRSKLEHLVGEVACATCGGSRLRGDAAAFRFQDYTIGKLSALPLQQSLEFFDQLKLPKAQQQVAGELLREIRNRLQFLVDVGLEYLTLDRAAPTLSGGESQRIRLASQIGSGLTGVLYVLDEPTIGLHPRDNRRLLQALLHLRDLGNTLILVEHDREIIAAADHLVDFGPGAGDRGGEITAAGSPKQLLKAKQSLTGAYLSGRKALPVPTNRRTVVRLGDAPAVAEVPALSRKRGRTPQGEKPRLRFSTPTTNQKWLTVKGAREHNLKDLDVHFPLGAFVAVTGVSGSGKSSLVNDILYNTLARRLHRARTSAAAHEDIYTWEAVPGDAPPRTGTLEHIDKVINVDQAPIGNSPTSNPATYTGVFDLMREMFAKLPDSKVRGYQPRRFSFNKPGGRCETCEGNGQKKIEMHFLPDVWVECDVCHGSRYNPETLAVRYKGKSIADVLTMRVSEALELFANIPKIRRVLQTLADVGLDYLSLGQAAPTLSGGEAQRVKLAAELSRPNTGRTLYLLDEPTTGLHFDDLRKLLEVLNRLVDLGNTVIVVEHNLDVIKTADWVIDLGPEAGEAGGYIVAEGTPEDIVARPKPRVADSLRESVRHAETVSDSDKVRESNRLAERVGHNGRSYTAEILADILAAGPHEERPVFDPLAEEAARDGDLDLADVGKDAAMPWEADGHRWHTQDRLDAHGKPCRWEGQILDWLSAEIHARGSFSDTNWGQRTQVEIAAPTRSHGWFLHASTGHEWLVYLTFCVGKNTFKQPELNASLGIKPLNETPGLEVYGNEDRVRVGNLKGPWQRITVIAHRLSEVDTPAFRAFLDQAAASFHDTLKRMRQSPEDVMPWKLNGERWHLGEKGFPVGKKLRWDRPLLPLLLNLIREIEPAVSIDWTTRDSISLRVPGVSRAWGHWRTKQAHALDVRFLGPKGQFNLSQIEPFGTHPTIGETRTDGDVLRFAFQHADHVHAEKLKGLLKEQLAGFKKTFGGKKATPKA